MRRNSSKNNIFMKRDMAPLFIGATDMFLCVLAVVIVAVAPSKAKVDGVKPHAEFLIQMDYPIDRDLDLDLWVVGPERKPVFYGSRQVGCADLDRDSLGFSTSKVAFSDGTVGQEDANKETISIRCLNPGHYDVAVNYFSNHGEPDHTMVPVHVDLTGLNPSVRTAYLKDVALDHVGQTINVFSFEMSKDGDVQIVDPPLTPVTQTFAQKSAP